jgi:predicted lipid-binding transport protein (Tim44 family)
MTSEHDKLLSEGPRTAPEPRTADGFAVPAPVETPTSEPEAEQFTSTEQPPDEAEQAPMEKPPLLRPGPQGSWGSSSGSWMNGSLLRRLIPLLLIVAVAGRGFAGGRAGSWAFALVWIVAAVVMIVLRTRGRRRW